MDSFGHKEEQRYVTFRKMNASLDNYICLGKIISISFLLYMIPRSHTDTQNHECIYNMKGEARLLGNEED